MTTQDKLISSIPANNQKIIEIYQKLQTGRLNIAPEFQRKLVWRRQHKIEFIETILKNFPFPEVYLAPEKVDTDKLELKEMVVDGQQRLTAIQDYIAGQGVFAQPASIPRFAELTTTQKEDFLNYEISVRYLKNASPQQIKEIFQRINRTDYSLNRMERFHAAWGDSELLCLAKQLIDKDLEINLDIVDFRVPTDQRSWLLEFFGVGLDEGVFSESEVNRMFSLQYILVLLVTLIQSNYFHRNTLIEEAVKTYNEQVPNAEQMVNSLVETTKFIATLNLAKNSIWSTKSSLFSMIVEAYQLDLQNINSTTFSLKLQTIEADIKTEESTDEAAKTYYGYTREAVNEKRARDYRGEYIRKLLSDSRN